MTEEFVFRVFCILLTQRECGYECSVINYNSYELL